MLLAFSITPLGTGDSVSGAVAEAVRIVRASGLPNETNAMFTNVEGSWDELMDLLRRCVEAVAEQAPAGERGGQDRLPARLRAPAPRQGRGDRGAARRAVTRERQTFSNTSR